MKLTRFLVLSLSGVALVFGACTTKKTPLPGERVSLLLFDNNLTAESHAPAVELPSSATNTTWAMSGGTASHTMPPLSFSGLNRIKWRTSVGSSGSYEGCLTSSPVVALDRIFTLDGTGILTAVSAENGQKLWSVELSPRTRNNCGLGGGVAYEDGLLFGVSSTGDVVALDPETGEILWRGTCEEPVRVAPTAEEGRLYIVTLTNHLKVFDQKTGKQLWSHEGIQEVTGLVGGASPAVAEGVVVVTYTSGEVYALRADNGRFLWSDTLNSPRINSSVMTVSHIRARPIIVDGHVYIVSHSGRLVAYDLRLGKRVWEKSLGASRSPAIGGNFLFILTNEAELVCLSREDGKIIWVHKLPRFFPNTQRRFVYTGPIVVNNALLITNQGEAMLMRASDGEKQQSLTLPGTLFTSPVVAENTAYFLLDSATLVAVD